MLLEEYSIIALYSAMFVYAIAFVFYVIDLANRSSENPHSRHRPSHKSVNAPVGSEPQLSNDLGQAASSRGFTQTLTRSNAQAAPAQVTDNSARRSKMLRVGFSLTVLGFALHLASTLMRGIGAERVPWSNMYEFALTATLAIVLMFLIVQFFVDLRFLGALIVGIAVVFLGVAKVNYYVPIVPLQPALDTYWLVIHVIIAVLAVAFFTLSFGLSVLQLIQNRLERLAKAKQPDSISSFGAFPDSARLENYSYRMAIIGFALWTFTLIAGAIWAEAAWSRYWGWDVKEVWTFVIWVLYAGFIHARATRGWRGNRSAWLAIIGYTAVIFNFTIVNVFFKGLHSYSGL